MAEKNDGFCIKVTAPPFRASIKSPNECVSLRSLANSGIPTNKMIFQNLNFKLVVNLMGEIIWLDAFIMKTPIVTIMKTPSVFIVSS